MEYWTEMRTALLLARHGTVSAAAAELGVHRATVNRHVHTLEEVLSTQLFFRHARGYTLTDAGQEMLEVASRADEMFSDFEGRSRGKSGRISGELVVTALSGVSRLIVPALGKIIKAHPHLDIEVIAEERLARLEYGEAHIAFRAGAKPKDPDYVVLHFYKIRFGLYASRDYVRAFGKATTNNLDGHYFVGSVGRESPLPYSAWMEDNVAPSALSLRTTDQACKAESVAAGIGMGFLAEHDAIKNTELVEIIPPSDEFATDIWIVTHGDLHRTEKVQAFLEYVRTPLN